MQGRIQTGKFLKNTEYGKCTISNMPNLQDISFRMETSPMIETLW